MREIFRVLFSGCVSNTLQVLLVFTKMHLSKAFWPSCSGEYLSCIMFKFHLSILCYIYPRKTGTGKHEVLPKLCAFFTSGARHYIVCHGLQLALQIWLKGLPLGLHALTTDFYTHYHALLPQSQLGCCRLSRLKKPRGFFKVGLGRRH